MHGAVLKLAYDLVLNSRYLQERGKIDKIVILLAQVKHINICWHFRTMSNEFISIYFVEKNWKYSSRNIPNDGCCNERGVVASENRKKWNQEIYVCMLVFAENVCSRSSAVLNFQIIRWFRKTTSKAVYRLREWKNIIIVHLVIYQMKNDVTM